MFALDVHLMMILSLFSAYCNPTSIQISVFHQHMYFFRRPTKSSPVSNVGNSLLLCPHGGFMFTYDSLINGEAQHIALLWPNEWEVISRLFIVDKPIAIHCVRQTTQDSSTMQYTTQPDSLKLPPFAVMTEILTSGRLSVNLWEVLSRLFGKLFQ
ncbi:hypothetical protein CHARACLAT_024617, partial [Characodon lateralis]|nr:hypothetical protein [Characodon lateralis]